MSFCCRSFQIILLICVTFDGGLADISPRVEDLRVNTLIVDYFQIEEYLWQVIERREENTLEQIYNEHKLRFGDSNHYENFIERNRISVDFELSGALKLLNETTAAVYGILKSQDFGGLNRFAYSPRVRSVTDALKIFNESTTLMELWHDIKDVSSIDS